MSDRAPSPWDGPGVPLSHYRDEHPGTGVQIICLGCCATTVLEMEPVLERLAASGEGDASTGVRALGKLVKRPCSRCGGTAFESRPAFKAPVMRLTRDC